uniref:Cytidyltransferase-like domain-containing protein n=1 Tax=Fibrocapsa japonica TaxID=94617 RepID=A0A7S2XWH9_9STRA
METMMKSLIFGLSANPPTGDGGHYTIVKYFAQSGMFDEILVVPVYTHMFQEKRGKVMVDYEKRVEMCKLCFLDASTQQCKVRISLVEQQVFQKKLREGGAGSGSGSPPGEAVKVGTADVVDHLVQDNPGVDYGFVVGTDTYRDLCNLKWRRAKELLDLLHFQVVERKGLPSPAEIPVQRLPARVDFHTLHELKEISSTSCRSSSDECEVRKVVKSNVVDYIVSNRLYGFTEDKKHHQMNRNRKSVLIFASIGIVSAFIFGMWRSKKIATTKH